MEHSHADHRGVHNRVLGEPEETPHLGLDTADLHNLQLPTSLSSCRLPWPSHSLGCSRVGVISESPFSLCWAALRLGVYGLTGVSWFCRSGRFSPAKGFQTHCPDWEPKAEQLHLTCF